MNLITLLFQVKLNGFRCSVWLIRAWETFLLAQTRLHNFSLVLKSSVTLTFLSSLVHKSKYTLTKLCLFNVKGWLADGVVLTYTSILFVILHLSLQICQVKMEVRLNKRSVCFFHCQEKWCITHLFILVQRRWSRVERWGCWTQRVTHGQQTVRGSGVILGVFFIPSE